MKKQLPFFAIFLGIILFSTSKTTAQTIEPLKGYDPQIGVVVSMLEDLKNRVTGSVENSSQEEIDFLLDDRANRIGAMIMHLAATEKYYQVYTLEDREFTEAERKKWETALSLGEDARETIKGQPIQYYLNVWDEVRNKTLELLKTKDDKWFNKKIKGSKANNHWAWYHVMEHQANHMGQIRLVQKRME